MLSMTLKIRAAKRSAAKKWAARLLPVAALAALTATTACAPKPVALVDTKSVMAARKIAVIAPAEPGYYELRWPGGAFVALDHLPKAPAPNRTVQAFKDNLGKQDLLLGPDLTTEISEALSSKGYQVTVVSVPHPQPAQFLANPLQSQQPAVGAADAVLDLVIPWAGYAHGGGKPYRPAIRLDARLTDVKSGKVILQRTYYCADPAAMRTHDPVLSCIGEYEFKNGGELLDKPAKVAAGLRATLPHLAKGVADSFK